MIVQRPAYSAVFWQTGSLDVDPNQGILNNTMNNFLIKNTLMVMFSSIANFLGLN